MVQQITQGIKISVKTEYQGTFYKDGKMQYAFAYAITIENTSKETVQLRSRFWKIKDSLNRIEIVEGEGVIGKKPILNPGERHSYASGCLLHSPIGAMRGHYNMINLATSTTFKVPIPLFNLSAPFSMN